MSNRSQNHAATVFAFFAFFFVTLPPVYAAPAPAALPAMDSEACKGALPRDNLIKVAITRSCDRNHDGANDCAGKNPYQCSLHCKGLTGVDLDVSMRMPIDQGNGTCARENVRGTLLWKGAVSPGNDRPGDTYTDPRRPLPSGVLLFGAYQDREILVATNIDYCDEALGDLRRCAAQRNDLQRKLAALESSEHHPGGSAATQAQLDPASVAAINTFYDKYNAAYQACVARRGHFQIDPNGTSSCMVTSTKINWAVVIPWILVGLLALGLALTLRALFSRANSHTVESEPEVQAESPALSELRAIRDLLRLPADVGLREAISTLRLILLAPADADLRIEATRRMQERKSSRDMIVGIVMKLGLDSRAPHSYDLITAVGDVVSERDTHAGTIRTQAAELAEARRAGDHSGCVSRTDHDADLATARASASHDHCVTRTEFDRLSAQVEALQAVDAVLTSVTSHAASYRFTLSATRGRDLKAPEMRALKAAIRDLFSKAGVPEQPPAQA